jgi:hypothetical protein
MLVLKYSQKGSDSLQFLQRLKNIRIERTLKKYGDLGVSALAEATPKDSGTTAASWSYEIKKDENGWSINWTNSNVNRGVNIAIILQYGHGTGTGGYVAGRDYINPALAPIFEELANDAWNEVTKA